MALVAYAPIWPTRDTDRPSAAEDRQPTPVKQPGAGRTTPLGRRTERPAREPAPGPSGQKSTKQQQKLHTNK